MKLDITRYWVAVAITLFIAGTSCLVAQGITTGAIGGKVVSSTGEEMVGANVVAVHVPSGTKYGTSSRANGRYVIPNVRVGGPYTVTVSVIGYKKVSRENVYTIVSQTTDVNFSVAEEAIQTAEQVVMAERNSVLSSTRTGAATNIDKQTFSLLPTI